MPIPYSMPGYLDWIVRRATQRMTGLRRTMAGTRELQMKAGAVLITAARHAAIAINLHCTHIPVSRAMTATTRMVRVGARVAVIRL